VNTVDNITLDIFADIFGVTFSAIAGDSGSDLPGDAATILDADNISPIIDTDTSGITDR